MERKTIKVEMNRVTKYQRDRTHLKKTKGTRYMQVWLHAWKQAEAEESKENEQVQAIEMDKAAYKHGLAYSPITKMRVVEVRRNTILYIRFRTSAPVDLITAMARSFPDYPTLPYEFAPVYWIPTQITHPGIGTLGCI